MRTTTPRGRPGRRWGEEGSATVELVLLTPALVLLALVAFAFGRVVDARILIEDAAHSAARAASLTTSPEKPSRPPNGPPPRPWLPPAPAAPTPPSNWTTTASPPATR